MQSRRLHALTGAQPPPEPGGGLHSHEQMAVWGFSRAVLHSALLRRKLACTHVVHLHHCVEMESAHAGK